MVATITTDNNVDAGAKFLEPVISVLRESLKNSHDLQAGTLENPSAENLASFLVTVIRTDGSHFSENEIHAYLASLCQNVNTSAENQLIGEAAQIALNTLQNDTETLSPTVISEVVTQIGGFQHNTEVPLHQQFAAIIAQQPVTH